MERFKELSGSQKLMILALLVMFLIFTILYAITTSRVGYMYMDTILVHSTKNGNAVYSGEIKGKQACFTVTPNLLVTFTYGDKTYGPYTVKNDPTAIPAGTMCTTGIEIRKGEEIFFRGGYYYSDGMRMLFDEDGSLAVDIRVSTEHGITMDSDGNVVDNMAPSASNLISLADGSGLTHKGSWGLWLLCTILVAATIVSILFADELFRMRLSFRVRDADLVDPTDWEVSRRYIGWTLCIILILVLYIKGLR